MTIFGKKRLHYTVYIMYAHSLVRLVIVGSRSRPRLNIPLYKVTITNGRTNMMKLFVCETRRLLHNVIMVTDRHTFTMVNY